MTNYAIGINPEILRWARNFTGLSISEVAQIMKKDNEEIQAWETGHRVPTYVQLEKMAYEVYKRPLAIFFFPEPPVESNPKKSFRTMPDFELENLSRDTLYAIRQAKALQLSLYELSEGINQSDYKIFNDIKISPDFDLVSLTKILRKYLNISLDKQIRWKSNEEAIDNWRDEIESKGIFIFKRSFKQKDISGFCLIDKEFPIILINNSTSKNRQIFTLFHELAHILLNNNGITKEDDSYIDIISGYERDVEIFCNKFASEFLVPNDDLEKFLLKNELSDDKIEMLSNRYKVSYEVILRKIYDRGLISKNTYMIKVAEWRSNHPKKKTKGGGMYYYNQTAYLGKRYLQLAFGNYYKGKCTVEQLAEHLNIKVEGITDLEHLISKKVSIV